MYKVLQFESMAAMVHFLNTKQIPKENIVKVDLKLGGFGQIKPVLIWIDTEKRKAGRPKKAETEN